MLRIHRVWKKANLVTKLSHRVLWEFGDEQWERIGFEDHVRHYRITSRWKEQEEVHEKLMLLPESPIPLEALGRHSIGSEWMVEDCEELVPFHLNEPELILPTHKKKTKKEDSPPPQPVLFVNQTAHEQQTQSDQESQATTSSQRSYTELWCSLSQWIPPNALFQPSLHLQASSELSDTPIPTSVVPSKRDTYSPPGRAQHPHVKRGLPTRHGHPRNFSQPFQGQFERKPLFI